MITRAFALEQLEDRVLFSVVAQVTASRVVTTRTIATPQVAAASTSPFTAVFNVAGTFTQPAGNPDTGAHYKFTGAGKSASLGTFTLKGGLQGPGFVANGRAHGRLVITTSKGTLILSARGPTQSPTSLPSSLSYSIVSGTGSYANSTGKGKIAVSASGTTHKFLFRVHPSTS